MTEVRKEVHEEIDRMPEEQVEGLKKLLASYPTPLDAACRNAPASDEPETEEEARLVAEADEWLRRNDGRGIPHEEIVREFSLE
ncbi:MAG: hypothetical protein F4Y47_04930 [Acidobacteriia bacterium]|nr:hypothetical protein [Terriglobia bacterium]MYG01888.1 hypothetical protein [Terriglobia bacterium]MYK10549.1 hypothetical protein [Terriglobia bacterium]